ncbi:MAG: hypothetical protein M3Y33_17795 [Actinomycetota bacterium]|nr:hypothetical protein [Actinomycetota bacterium]
MVYAGPTEEIGDLHCQRFEPGLIVSVWEPDEEERKLLAEGGRVQLWLWTEPIPPITINVLRKEDSQPVGPHPFRVNEQEKTNGSA